MRLRVLVTVVLLAAVGTAAAGAQECRPQTAEEHAVVIKLVGVLQTQMRDELTTNKAWTVTREITGADRSVAAGNPVPFRPMMLCNSVYTLTLTAAPGTPRAQAAELARTQISSGALTTVALIRAATATVSAATITIRAEFNDPNNAERSVDPRDHKTVLQVPGADAAVQVEKVDPETGARGDEWVTLYFGKWSSPSGTYIFTHKTKAAAIENFSVRLTGDLAAVLEMVKQVDWSRMQGGLSP
jgi:hypothetical protein